MRFGLLQPGAVTRRPEKREVKEGRQREAGLVKRSPYYEVMGAAEMEGRRLPTTAVEWSLEPRVNDPGYSGSPAEVK